MEWMNEWMKAKFWYMCVIFAPPRKNSSVTTSTSLSTVETRLLFSSMFIILINVTWNVDKALSNNSSETKTWRKAEHLQYKIRAKQIHYYLARSANLQIGLCIFASKMLEFRLRSELCPDAVIRGTVVPFGVATTAFSARHSILSPE